MKTFTNELSIHSDMNLSVDTFKYNFHLEILNYSDIKLCYRILLLLTFFTDQLLNHFRYLIDCKIFEIFQYLLLWETWNWTEFHFIKNHFQFFLKWMLRIKYIHLNDIKIPCPFCHIKTIGPIIECRVRITIRVKHGFPCFD